MPSFPPISRGSLRICLFVLALASLFQGARLLEAPLHETAGVFPGVFTLGLAVAYLFGALRFELWMEERAHLFQALLLSDLALSGLFLVLRLLKGSPAEALLYFAAAAASTLWLFAAFSRLRS